MNDLNKTMDPNGGHSPNFNPDAPATETRPIPDDQVRVTGGPETPSQNDPQRPYDEKTPPTMQEFLALQSRVVELEAWAERMTVRFRDK